MMKQMKYLYEFENDYPPEELFAYRRIVVTHVLASLKAMCQELLKRNMQCKEENMKHVQLILSIETDEEKRINEHLGFAAKQLWKDDTIRKIFEKRDEYTIYDNSEYFLSDLERVFDPNFRPTFTDILKARVQTTGVIEEEFLYKGLDNKPERYLIVDVGGQRSERSKWASQFTDVIAVLWVFALSSYDQVLFEDTNTNRMMEEFTLFRDTSKHQAFEKTNFIVLLNKFDQFQDKVERIPFDFSFENYKYKGNPKDTTEIIEWIKDILRNLDVHQCLYFHVTTAIDTEKFSVVFADCHEIILREHFKRAGAF
jgi:GTPase SAR1 family protein